MSSRRRVAVASGVLAVAAVGVVVAVAAGGDARDCGSRPGREPETSPAPPSGRSEHSRLVTYRTVEQLAGDSALVVRGRATRDQTILPTGPVPPELRSRGPTAAGMSVWQCTVIVVSEVLKGEHDEASLTLYVLSSDRPSAADPTVTPGDEYLLFLFPFTPSVDPNAEAAPGLPVRRGPGLVPVAAPSARPGCACS